VSPFVGSGQLLVDSAAAAAAVQPHYVTTSAHLLSTRHHAVNPRSSALAVTNADKLHHLPRDFLVCMASIFELFITAERNLENLVLNGVFLMFKK